MIKFLIFLVAYTVATPIEPRVELEDYRLPEGAVELSRYEIELRIENNIFTTKEFKGIVSIWFKNLKNTNEIKLHANKISFQVTKLYQLTTAGEEEEITLSEENYLSDNITDVLTVVSTQQLQANTDYKLYFEYTGLLRTEEMYGFYLSSYVDANNDVKYLGTTQFQPTSARKAFPCFDEPEYKAVFDIKIRHPGDLLPLALGNTPGQDAVDPADPNFLITTFEPTPKMSTYLIAFVVSDFTCSTSPNNNVHHICSRNESAPNRDVALNFGPKLIEVMEEITQIKYLDSGIGKMHQVAIPDFSAGAMENWGLITYRETGLLYDEEQSSNSYKQSIQNVISHEIAHMWFGNLVTCKWWSNTFLNEGFARLYQYFATGAVETTWQLDKQFVTAQVQPMLVNDAQPSAAALSADVYTQAQVSSRFGSVSYNKGASVLRMLQHVISEENFNKGLQNYLATNKYGATIPEDLWTGIEPSIAGGILPSGTNLSAIMDSWINKAGYPILQVANNGSAIIVSQKRFLLSGTPDPNDKWYVPIAYTVSTDTNKFEDTSARAWLLPTEDLVIDTTLEDSEWIILNNQQTGYYRVQYDDDLLNRIERALNSENFGGIHELNRAHLVDDIYNLAKIDAYGYARIFEFFTFLRNETSYFTWNSAFTAFSNMLSRTGDDKITEALSSLILALLQKVYESVPFDEPHNDDQIYTFNRVQAITWACRLNQEDCKKKAVDAFIAYFENPEVKPDKNLKSVIYCNGLRHSSNITEHWAFLWNEYSNSKLATEEATILSALGCAQDQGVLNDFLNKSITVGSGIRQQDASSVFSSVYTQNPGGVDIAYDFLVANWRAISDYYGSMNALNNLFTGLAARFTKDEQVTRLREFLQNSEDDFPETVKTAAENALANAEANLQLNAKFEAQLIEYFKLSSGTADSVRIGFITSIMSVILVLYQIWM